MDYFVSGSSGTFGLEADQYDVGLDTSWAICGKGSLTRLHLSGVMVSWDDVNIYTGYRGGDGSVCLDSFPQELEGDFGYNMVIDRNTSSYKNCVVVWLHTRHFAGDTAPDYYGDSAGSFSLTRDEYKSNHNERWVVMVDDDNQSYIDVSISGEVGQDDRFTLYQAHCTGDYFASYQTREGEHMSGALGDTTHHFKMTEDHNCFYVSLESAASTGDMSRGDYPAFSVEYCTGWDCRSRWIFWFVIAGLAVLLVLAGVFTIICKKRKKEAARLEEEAMEAERLKEAEREREERRLKDDNDRTAAAERRRQEREQRVKSEQQLQEAQSLRREQEQQQQRQVRQQSLREREMTLKAELREIEREREREREAAGGNADTDGTGVPECEDSPLLESYQNSVYVPETYRK
ncbi:hypothetical protein KIPB_000809 [Kipferlia bialata]|uniref:Uncharacterized protein n=1 Tax=Kipferlia bialata TaxID=797122 RepID=A0A9K3CMW0_9EUKA|nr:hypothetical protein KIPB_000809 [Kipferlia bialata]|eukprot:g809.t1